MSPQPRSAARGRRALSRRGFCAGLAALAAGGLLARWVPGGAAPERSLPAALLACFPHRRSAAALGRAYLAEPRAEAHAAHLAAALRRDLALAPGPLEPAALAGALDARIRRDFEEGRVVSVRGWVLSLTEARACALVSLA